MLQRRQRPLQCEAGGRSRSAPRVARSRMRPPQTFVKDVIEESRRSRCWSISGRRGAAPASSSRRCLEKAVKAAKGKVKLVKMNIDEHPEIPGRWASSRSPPCSPSSTASRSTASWARCRTSRSPSFVERLIKDRSAASEGEIWSRAPMPRSPPGDSRRRRRYSMRRCSRRRAPTTSRRWPGSRALLCRHRQCRAGARRRSTWCRTPSRTIPAVAAARAEIELAEQTKDRRLDRRSAKPKVAADPADHQARFDLALALECQGRSRRRADHLLDDRQARPQMER